MSINILLENYYSAYIFGSLLWKLFFPATVTETSNLDSKHYFLSITKHSKQLTPHKIYSDRIFIFVVYYNIAEPFSQIFLGNFHEYISHKCG